MKKLLLMMLLVAGCFMNANAYDLWIAGVKIETEGQITGSAITRGKVSYNNNTKTLTLDNAVIESQTDPAIESNIDGLTIEIINECSAQANASAAISLGANTTIKGTWDKTSPYPTFNIQVADWDYAGISALSKNMKLTFSKGVRTHISSGRPSIDMNPEGSNLILDNCELRAECGVRNVCSCTMINTDIESLYYSEYVYFNEDKKTFTNLEGRTVEVHISYITVEYPIQIMGKKMNNVNYKSYHAEEMTSGKITYNPYASPKKLTLDGVTLTSDKANVSAIKICDTSEEIVIEMKGNNNITAAGNVLNLDNAENVTITTGEDTEGTTTFKSTGSSAIYSNSENSTTIYTAQDLFLEGAGTTGSSYAYMGSGGELVLKKKSSDSKVYMKGKDGVLSNTELTFTNMDFYYRGEENQTPGCYYDNGQVYQNGRTLVKDQYVCVGGITESYYGLIVGGTVVNSCNRMGIGSKYITKGGGTAVTYNNTTNTLTLNGATINTGDATDVNGIRNDLAVDLTIECRENTVNTITNTRPGYNAQSAPMYFGRNTTITGIGSLEVKKNPIVVDWGSTLTVKDAPSVVLYGAVAYPDQPGIETPNKLVVDKSNVTVNILFGGFDKVTWPNSYLMTPAGGHYDETKRYFVDEDGNRKNNIVFIVSGQVEINEANFPNDYFRARLRDKFGDFLDDDEIIETTTMDYGGIDEIDDLTGIRYFKALKKLSCGYDQLTSLDLSGLTELEEVLCYGNHLTSLNVSGCTSLKNIRCEFNNINGENMEALVESLPTVAEGDFVVIELNRVEHGEAPDGNEITALQVAAAKAKGWSVKSIDYWWGIEGIADYDGTAVAGISINATNFPDENFRAWLLAQSYGEDGYLTNEEIEDITEIKVGHCYISDLTGIGNFTNLASLDCHLNNLTSLDISNFNLTNLRDLNCDLNNLTSLDVSNCKLLWKLDCGNNKLNKLVVSGCTKLTDLTCWYNSLTTLDVSGCSELKYLNCGSNKLTSLNVSGCTALNNINCEYSQLTSLDLSGCPALNRLTIYRNKIKGAGMSTLVGSLPEVTDGELFVLSGDEDEENEITEEQAAAAKEKGWRVFAWYSGSWISYDAYIYIITGINATLMDPEDMNNGKWYSLSGQQLVGMPTQKGVYIHNGRKVVIM